jgi:fibronectin-binding autotransporter adhesin
MAKTINKTSDASERKFSQLDSASGGGAGAPGGNAGDGGAGGSAEGGGTGGNYSTIAQGAPGTLASGGKGGGALGAQGGVTGSELLSGGQISSNVSGGKGGDGASGASSYGGGGGGGGLGVAGGGTLTINNAMVAGGDGGAASSGSQGSAGNGGGGAGMVVTGPATINILASSPGKAGVTGGSTAGTSGLGGADGGGGVGVYFAGSSSGTNSLTNAGSVTGGSSSGGGGGAALVLTDGITVNNNGGTVSGGASHPSSKGQTGAGGPGLLIRGSNNTVNNIVGGATIQGGESSDGNKVPPGILVQGDANTIITASKILSGTDLVNKSQVSAIEFNGYKNTLEIRNGYDFGKGNVLYKEPRGGVLVLGGSTDVSSFDLSSIGPLNSGVVFQGFYECEKRGASTWVVSGAPSGLGRYNVAEGILRLTGSGDLSPVERAVVGSSGTLDISGVTTPTTTLPNLITDDGSQILLGNKALTLSDGGDLEGTITGNSGITVTGTQELYLLSTCKISSGPFIVKGFVYLTGATIVGDVTTEGDFGAIESFIIDGNFTVAGTGALRVGDTKTMQQSGIIKGNLDFRGGASTKLDINLFSGELDLSMLEVSGTVNLNNVTLGLYLLPNAASGNYGLVHASGGISGSAIPVVGSLQPSWRLQVSSDRSRLELIVP